MFRRTADTMQHTGKVGISGRPEMELYGARFGGLQSYLNAAEVTRW